MVWRQEACTVLLHGIEFALATKLSKPRSRLWRKISPVEYPWTPVPASRLPALHPQLLQQPLEFFDMSALSKGGGSEHSAAKELDGRQRQNGLGAPLDSLDSGLISNVSSDPELSFKTRRINKACDECRGRKVKCDGRRPCLPCSSLDMGK